MHQGAGTRSSPAFKELRLIIITRFCCQSGRWAVSSLQKTLQEEDAATSALKSWANIPSWKLPGEKSFAAGQAGYSQQMEQGLPRSPLQHQIQSSGSQTPAPPKVPLKLGNAVRTEKSELRAAQGLSSAMAPLWDSAWTPPQKHFSSPLLYFPATDNDINLWNWNKKTPNCLFKGNISHLFHFHGLGVILHFSIFAFSCHRLIS